MGFAYRGWGARTQAGTHKRDPALTLRDTLSIKAGRQTKDQRVLEGQIPQAAKGRL